MSSLWAVVVVTAMTQVPANGAGGYQGGYYGGSGGSNIGSYYSAVGGPVGPGMGGYDQLYPFDHEDNWVHGYYQDIPAYGGQYYFRPHNYKHVLSQSQVAAGWGMSPTMPYSHEFFRKAAQPQARYGAPAPAYTELPRPPVRNRVVQQREPDEIGGPALLQPTRPVSAQTPLAIEPANHTTGYSRARSVR